MFCLKFPMALAKSSESPLQNRLKIFVDDQKLEKLCVSRFESKTFCFVSVLSY